MRPRPRCPNSSYSPVYLCLVYACWCPEHVSRACDVRVARWAMETDVEQRAITVGTGETRIEARGNFAEESIGLLHELGIQELAVDVAALQADRHRRQVGFNCSHGC